MSAFEAKEPALAKRVYKQFIKCKDEADKDKSKIKFSLCSYIETLEAFFGTEALRKGEMMWEQEYLEFAKSVKASCSD